MSEQRSTVEIQKEQKKGDRGKNMAAAALSLILLSGISGMLRPLYYSELCVGAGMLSGTAALFLLSLTTGRGRAEKWGKISLYVFCLAACILCVGPLLQAFLYLADQLAVLWNARFGTEFERLAVGDSAGFGSLVLWGLLSVATAFGLFWGIRRREPAVPVGLGTAAMFLGFLSIRTDATVATGLLLAGFCGMFIYMGAPERKLSPRLGFSLLALALVLVGISFVSGGYRKQFGLEKWKASMADGFERLRYGEDTLPQGDLTRRAGLTDGTKERLRLTLETPEELYLRGFVGSVYTGINWKKLPSSSYETDYQGIFSWLDVRSFSPVHQYADYERLTAADRGQTLYREAVQVENQGASRKYLYLPAAAELGSQRAKVKKDGSVQGAEFLGVASYEFTLTAGDLTADAAVQADWLGAVSDEAESAYLDAEAVYRSFVESVYLELEEEQESRLKELFFKDTDPAELTLEELTVQIRQVLRSEARYADQPEEIPAGQDAVDWFLWGGHSGNAVDYATAAVLAYRAAGYPARYAEGYRLSAAQAENAVENGETTVELTTRDAHAWAEIYVAGMGWLPVEVVPGMYTETYTSEQVEGRPVYRVHAVQDEKGMTAETGGKNEELIDEPESQSRGIRLRTVFAGVLLACYLCLCLFLILEVQRGIRKAWKKRQEERFYPDGVPAEEYVERSERLMALTGIHGMDPYFFERAVNLARKARFGGKKMTPAELHAMRCYQEELETMLAANSSLPRRLVLRYVYLIK